jgi:hypothetical protein
MQFLHPLQDLLGPSRSNLLSRPRPSIDDSIEDASSWPQICLSSFLVDLVHVMQDGLGALSSISAFSTLGPRVHCQRIRKSVKISQLGPTVYIHTTIKPESTTYLPWCTFLWSARSCYYQHQILAGLVSATFQPLWHLEHSWSWPKNS